MPKSRIFVDFQIWHSSLYQKHIWIMECIKDNEKWQPTREDYLKLEEKHRDLENSYIHLYNVR